MRDWSFIWGVEGVVRWSKPAVDHVLENNPPPKGISIDYGDAGGMRVGGEFGSLHLTTLEGNCGVAVAHYVLGKEPILWDWVEDVCRKSPYNYLMVGHVRPEWIDFFEGRGYKRVLDFLSKRSDNYCVILAKEL